jgi:hypothetical protein
MLTKESLLKKISTSGIVLSNLIMHLNETSTNTDNLTPLLHELEQDGLIVITQIKAPKHMELEGSYQTLLQRYSIDKDGNKCLSDVDAFKKQRITVVKSKTFKKLKKQAKQDQGE